MVDVPLAQRVKPDLREFRALKEASNIFLIPTETIQRLAQNDIDAATDHVLHKLLHSRPQQQGGAGNCPVGVDAYDGPSFLCGLFAKNPDLVID
nr:hypothetical protein [Phreatobacter sp.]